jgi:hypothetical protein
MRLYDTARRDVVPFTPNELVLMYTCGITPYDATHLGHASTFLFYDILQRRLIDLGHTVRCVRNVTDVDDPLFAKARELGVHYLDLAAGEEARFVRRRQLLIFANSSDLFSSVALLTPSAGLFTLMSQKFRPLVKYRITATSRCLSSPVSVEARWMIRRNGIHSILFCGTHRLKTNQHGMQHGERVAPVGTSSVRHLHYAT